MTIVRVRRAVKINIGNYENTDVSIELEGETDGKDLDAIVNAFNSYCKGYLQEQVDEIELGTRKASSKAKRFGL